MTGRRLKDKRFALFVEILFLAVLFAIAEVTGSLVFYVILIVAFFLCLPGIIALNSAPFVPTLKENAGTMLAFAQIKPGMKVYDLGAGDGRLIKRAAKQGADAVGYEISFTLFLYSWIKKAVFRSKGKVIWGSFWGKDISDADVVLCFLMPRAMDRFKRKKYNTLKKGTRIVSNIFSMEGERPVKQKEGVYLYIKK